jgi:hypothetical protein
MRKNKYALLDTDFISKMYIIQKDTENHLIDRIMELPQYKFYCHSQIQEELDRHNDSGASKWLEEKIKTGKISCYSDKGILNETEKIYGASVFALYAGFLKTACEAYKTGYFEENFKKLGELDYRNIEKDGFLEKLDECCNNIGLSQNLGEIKTYVLLQELSLMLGEQIYVFCSDDRNARSGIVSIGGVRCISVLSSFLRLKKECGFQMDDAKEYIKSWLKFCYEKNQTTFRIQDNSKEHRFCRVPCEQVMREIYEDKFEELYT